jgi:membrane carboxypeptidase/penicillin-binding protein PbpC
METILGFAAVVLATLVSLFLALAVQGLLMKLAFQLMPPATAGRAMTAAPIERGTRMVARVYARATR